MNEKMYKTKVKFISTMSLDPKNLEDSINDFITAEMINVNVTIITEKKVMITYLEKKDSQESR